LRFASGGLLVETDGSSTPGYLARRWWPFLDRRAADPPIGIIMKLSLSSLVLASLVFTGNASATPADAPASQLSDAGSVLVHDWIAHKDANICGISKLKRVTNPALVDYETVMAATPQMIEIRERDIDPDSVQGRSLREAARSLLCSKAQLVQKEGGYDGIWKSIKNRDGRAIDDVSDEVIALF